MQAVRHLHILAEAASSDRALEKSVGHLLRVMRSLCPTQDDGTARRHLGSQLMLQLVAAVLLIGLLAVGVVGLSLRSHVGQQCEWCDGFACPRIKWWECHLSSQLTTDITPATSPAAGVMPSVTPSSPTSTAPISMNDTTTVNYG